MKKLKACKHITVFLLLVSILLMLFPVSLIAAYDKSTLDIGINSIVSFYKSEPRLDSWWELVALKGAGQDLNDTFWQRKLPQWKNADLDKVHALATDYAGYILGFIAMGKDPSKVWPGRDMAAELAARQSTDGYFGNGAVNMHIWSMIALDAAYGSYNREKAIAWLLKQQKSDGGFALTGSSGDPDVTGMALLVLSGYRDGSGVNAAIDKAVAFLKTAQRNSGGFSSWGAENSNSAATVISGLVSAGQDVTSDIWKKGGHTIVDALMSYRLSNKLFSFKKGGGYDPVATVQALIALEDIREGKSVFQRLLQKTVHVRAEGIGSNMADTDINVISNGSEQTALDALRQVLDYKKITYEVKNASFGEYVNKIGGETAGCFGGYDGWLYLVNGTAPSVGADHYKITDGDDIVFYYGSFAPDTLIPQVTIKPVQPQTGDPLTVTVSSSYDDWSTGSAVKKDVKITGAVVSFDGQNYTTDSSGKVIIPGARLPGSYVLKVSKDNENSCPSIVRTGKIYVTFEKPAAPYQDLKRVSDWALQYVQKAAQYRLMQKADVSNNVFEPGRKITRAEFTTVLLRLLGEQPSASFAQVFNDVKRGSWYAGYVIKAKQKGLITGSNGRFEPDRPISRQELAVMITRAFNLTETDMPAGMKDLENAAGWAKPSVLAVYNEGIMTGDNGLFNPGKPVTREMAATVAVRLYELNNQ